MGLMPPRILALLLIVSSPINTWADWSTGLGLRNPFTADLGINFLHIWPRWGLELGIGTVSLENQSDDTDGFNLGGGVTGKYFFKEGLFRPFVQLGLGLSAGVTGDGAGRGSDGILFGFGLYVWASEFYIYGSYGLANSEGFYQMGIGFPLTAITGGGSN